MGILNACGRFAVPTLASTFFNLGSVVFGVTLGFWMGPRLGIAPITGMAWGVVLGGALQLFGSSPACAGSVLDSAPASTGPIPACATSSL